MKKEYEGLEIRVIELTGLDILTVSLGKDNDGTDESGWELPID